MAEQLTDQTADLRSAGSNPSKMMLALGRNRFTLQQFDLGGECRDWCPDLVSRIGNHALQAVHPFRKAFHEMVDGLRKAFNFNWCLHVQRREVIGIALAQGLFNAMQWAERVARSKHDANQGDST